MAMDWNYLLAHAQEIMYLCFGVGFFLVCLVAVRFIWIGTKVLRKIDDLSDLFIEYIQKPLRLFMEAQHVFSKVLGWFKK